LETVRRDPRCFGYARSRWTLQMLLQQCPWLTLRTAGGLHRLLGRLGLSYKRARDHVRSPDVHYEEKQALLQRYLLRAWYAPERYVFLYQDEMTYFRQPSLAQEYAARGKAQPLARRSYARNDKYRVVATLDALSGRVIWQQRGKIGPTELVSFYEKVCASYPHAEQIYIAQDNWPIHFHPDVLARLQAQDFPWPPRLSPAWRSLEAKKAPQAPLPIQLVLLPTYASWLNPCEKLWRWLKQNTLHLHRLSNDWAALKAQVATSLDQFLYGSMTLLAYVGLLPD